jgi:hypothetical protein
MTVALLPLARARRAPQIVWPGANGMGHSLPRRLLAHVEAIILNRGDRRISLAIERNAAAPGRETWFRAVFTS